MGIAGTRTQTNSLAGAKGGLGGALGYLWYYLNEVVNWNINEVFQPENLETLITWALAFFGIGGSIAAWNRDQPNSVSYIAPTFGPDPSPKWAPVEIPKDWFTRAELECKGQSCDCEYPGMSSTTMKIANELRERFGPIVVTSAHRCAVHNAEVGGAKNSYHLTGRAIDLKAVNATALEMYRHLISKYPGQYGFGLYRTFIHVDDRTDSWARKKGPTKDWESFDNDMIGL